MIVTISIHALREEGDEFGVYAWDPDRISIHALREEGDLLSSSSTWAFTNFYPRPPRGGRHLQRGFDNQSVIFLSTPSARRATAALCTVRDELEISIHALREEGDRNCERQRRQAVHISIHALREEGDLTSHRSPCATVYFYPRPPRGGRQRHRCCPPLHRRISIHALREEGDGWHCPSAGSQQISIHALREEGDAYFLTAKGAAAIFLSTPSARRATERHLYPPCHQHISIHALREEGDGLLGRPCRRPAYFYPRPPRGGRHTTYMTGKEAIEFLSTPSARRATGWHCPSAGSQQISIHALREEGDLFTTSTVCEIRIFLSTPSARRATTTAPAVFLV